MPTTEMSLAHGSATTLEGHELLTGQSPTPTPQISQLMLTVDCCIRPSPMLRLPASTEVEHIPPYGYRKAASYPPLPRGPFLPRDGSTPQFLTTNTKHEAHEYLLLIYTRP
jgi:hypothetical protein